MVENDAALHRCVDEFVRRAEDLLDAGYTRSFIVQALQGAIARVSMPFEEATVITLHHPIRLQTSRRTPKPLTGSVREPRPPSPFRLATRRLTG